MRIAVVVNTAWNVYNFRLGLLTEFQRKGYEIHIVAPADEYVPGLKALGFYFHSLEMPSKGTNPLSDLRLLWQLRMLYSRIRPSVCLHYTIKPNLYGTLAASWLGIPVINNVTGLGTAFIRPGLINRIVRILYKIAFPKADKIFFQNQDDLQLFLTYQLVHAEQCELLPGSGVNLEKFKPSPKRPQEPLVFLMVARILVDKGVREYLEAANQLSKKYTSIRFLLIGAFDEASGFGVKKEEVMKAVDLGYLEYQPFTDQISEAYACADAVVLPSYREGTPKTLLEAAAMAKPLISTLAPGCKDVVREGLNGFLCEVRNATSLAASMEKFILLSAEEKINMGMESRKLAEKNFDEKLVIKAYENAIDQLLSYQTKKRKSQ
ncbi:MAG: glycosyltransferase family 4 protein [Cytophagaceae bacterium]|jgi:glycosyltransferase involved in cell wall biosynthesis|nr:glycosyltransferase family 4 protein [Cytophagaceae bacterium]